MKSRRRLEDYLAQFLHCIEEDPGAWSGEGAGKRVRLLSTPAAEGWTRGCLASSVSPKLEALVDDSTKALYIQLKISGLTFSTH